MARERVGNPDPPLCQVADGHLLVPRIPSVTEGGNVTKLDDQASLTIRPRGQVLQVVGELDMATAPALAEALRREVDGIVCLDLSDVPFLDSTGAHVLLKAARDLDDGCIIVHGARPNVAKVFEILGFTSTGSNVHILYGHGAA